MAGRLLILNFRRPTEHDKLRVCDVDNRRSFFNCECGRSLQPTEEEVKRKSLPQRLTPAGF